VIYVSKICSKVSTREKARWFEERNVAANSFISMRSRPNRVVVAIVVVSVNRRKVTRRQAVNVCMCVYVTGEPCRDYGCNNLLEIG
jgi:hypothetical protein